MHSSANPGKLNERRTRNFLCSWIDAKANKPAEFKIYPGAPHGFHADYRASYRKEAAEDAWNRMQAWFKQHKVLS
jgi:dienelactone hydrolase